MALEFRVLIDRFCKILYSATLIDSNFLDKLDDEFLISSNLCIKFLNDGSFEIHSMEKKGLSVLFELQKCQDFDLSEKYCSIFVNYLMEIGNTYLALFFMKTLSSFNKETIDLALNNAISILSKVFQIILFLELIFVVYKNRKFPVETKTRTYFWEGVDHKSISISASI